MVAAHYAQKGGPRLPSNEKSPFAREHRERHTGARRVGISRSVFRRSSRTAKKALNPSCKAPTAAPGPAMSVMGEEVIGPAGDGDDGDCREVEVAWRRRQTNDLVAGKKGKACDKAREGEGKNRPTTNRRQGQGPERSHGGFGALWQHARSVSEKKGPFRRPVFAPPDWFPKRIDAGTF